MKKSLLALAALTAFAGAASAQSSVTLFGIVDVNARQVDNATAGKLRTLSTDGNASSRLGFRGIEDLGGGLRAGFWLEGAFGADTGTGGASVGNGSASQTWQRRATVSLIGGFGEVRLGRDYTATFNNVVTYDPWGYVGVATLANIRTNFAGAGATATTSGAGTAVRANNTVSYFLPALGGLYGQVQVAAAEAATGNKYAGARLGYAAGPVNVSGAYGKTYRTGLMADDVKQVSFGASFDAGFLKVMALYEKTDYSVEDQKLGQVGLTIPVGSGNIKASYTQTKGSTAVGSGDRYAAKLIAVGYVYDLSKRTALYAQYGRIQNAGNATTATSGATFTASGGGLAGIRGGETSTGVEAGIRHNF